MSYPYLDPKVDFSHRVKLFSELSLPDGDDKGFDPDFSTNMPNLQGYELDEIAQRDFKRYSGNMLSSCDSISLGDDGNYYLVEFKNQRSSNIDGNSIRKKIIDSISLIRYTFSPDEPMSDLYSRIRVYIVFPDQEAFLNIVKIVSSSGSSEGSIVKKRPLWKLDELVDADFVGYIDTLPLSEFKDEVTRWPKMLLPVRS
jgi:hypothetical protein